MIDTLNLIYKKLIDEVQTKQHRFLFNELHLGDRLTGLLGPRGVGKTTLLLQYIKEKLAPNECFYFSADHIYFHQTTLYEFVLSLYQEKGVRYFFIDEIHKYKNWNQELKNLYDGFSDLIIVFSGSSSLDIIKGGYDLSRRAKLFQLPGMSFREYLNLTTSSQHQTLSWDELIDDYQRLDSIWLNTPKILGHFQQYLKTGFYPFYYEQPLSYYEKLLTIIDKTVSEDIAEFYQLKTQNLAVLKKVVLFLASTPPGKISTHNLAKNLSIDDKTALRFLHLLHETGLATLIYTAQTGNPSLRRPTKAFINNTNLLYALEKDVNTSVNPGSLRELFFLQSLAGARETAYYSKQGDYEVNGLTFEIGGKSKTRQQIKGLQSAFLVKDSITVSSKNEIPLMAFGFLY